MHAGCCEIFGKRKNTRAVGECILLSIESILLSIEIEVLDTGNLNCGKWLEALLDDVFLAVINLFGGLSMLSFLLSICERSFQQLKMDGMD